MSWQHRYLQPRTGHENHVRRIGPPSILNQELIACFVCHGYAFLPACSTTSSIAAPGPSLHLPRDKHLHTCTLYTLPAPLHPARSSYLCTYTLYTLPAPLSRVAYPLGAAAASESVNANASCTCGWKSVRRMAERAHAKPNLSASEGCAHKVPGKQDPSY